MEGNGQRFWGPSDCGSQQVDPIKFDFLPLYWVEVAAISFLDAPTNVQVQLVGQAITTQQVGLGVEYIECIVAFKAIAGFICLKEGESKREVAQTGALGCGLGRQGELLSREMDLSKIGGLCDGRAIEPHPVDEVVTPAVEEMLGQHEPMPAGQVCGEPVSEFKVFRFFGEQVLTALRTADCVVQIGIGRHPNGASRGSKGHSAFPD